MSKPASNLSPGNLSPNPTRGQCNLATRHLSLAAIYGLIACIFLVSAPHVAHLPLWVSVLTATLMIWRIYLAYQNLLLPKRWLLTLITLASMVSIFLTFRTLFGREVSVTLLILLTTLKLLELRTQRDAIVTIYLACFIIITNFFYSQSMPTALFMLFTLVAILTTWLHLQTGDLGFRPRLRMALILLAQAIPLTLILFVLFPRVPGPLWGLPQNAYSTSGLDDTMSPGSLSKLSLSEAVAFRAQFSAAPPLREQMYWRGPVLWAFDGRTWTAGAVSASKPATLDTLQNSQDYTITLEPHNKKWLFALEMPTKISIPSRVTDDFQTLLPNNVITRLRYTAQSHLGFRANAEETEQQLQRALTLPATLNPRARELAAEWRSTLNNSEAIVRAAFTYFNREKFEYTLEPPPLLGLHTVDDFIFETRKGFCEHYASSFVFLMRAAGIPARVVTGYQGAEYNELGNYYIVRQSDAHAWAEVWIAGRGWIRIDPTAAVSISRVQNGLAASQPDNSILPFMARTQSPLLRNLRLNLDALTNQWNQWVLGYNTEQQFAFLTRLGMQSITWQNMVISLMIGLAALIGFFALLMLRHLIGSNVDTAQRLYLKFCRKLLKINLVRAEYEGAQDFAARAIKANPQLTAAITRITNLYLGVRYGGEANSAAMRALRHAVTSFKL